MIDIHCHILPEVDDGSGSMKESIHMVEIAINTGVNEIIATPHSNIPGSFQNYIDTNFFCRFTLLQNEIEKNFLPLQIYPGLEIFCTNKTVDHLLDGSLITLNNSRYPLVEFDFTEYSSSCFEKLKKLTAAGFTPIVAHPERYEFLLDDEDAVGKIKQLGCLIQVNRGSLFGRFGPAAKYNAEKILDYRLADFIASDAHSPYMRTTAMDDAYEYICEYYSDDYAELLLEYNPRCVIENKEITPY